MKFIVLGLLCLCIFKASGDATNPLNNEDKNAENWSANPDHSYDVPVNSGEDVAKDDEGQELSDKSTEELQEKLSTEDESEENKEVEIPESANKEEFFDEKQLASDSELSETEVADDKQAKSWGWRRRRRYYIRRRRSDPCLSIRVSLNRCIQRRNWLQAKVNRLINRINRLKSRIQRKNVVIQGLKTRIRQLVSVINNLRARIQNLRNSLNHVTQKHNALVQRFNKLLALTRKLKAKYLILSAKYRQILTENKQLRALVKTQSNQIQSLKGQNAQLQTQIVQHVLDKKALRVQVKKYKRKFYKAQYDLEKCRLCCDACSQKYPTGKNSTVTNGGSTKAELTVNDF
ncbi:hypothetical protein TrispH2_002207 [Trichoplax sp. H2]|nr:hypothetical protein TrispH2_002207 [Trichoplax sp. H2]|eukprot:RDD45804.1 hypothetical protein TrispH2_002207 [Trichoplax sp. H2]